MGRIMAAFYSPEDDCEHGITFTDPDPADPSSGWSFMDWTFSPTRKPQTNPYPALPYTAAGTQAAVAGTYAPPDSRRYLFFCSKGPAGSEIEWTRWASPYVKGKSPKETLISANHLSGTVAAFPADLVDMAAHFNGLQLEVAALTAGGTLQIFSGAPWNATSWSDTKDLTWTVTNIQGAFPDAKRIAISQAAGAGHVFLASDSAITEVWYYTGNQGHVQQTTFTNQILDVGNVFTPDGIMHVVVATIDPNSNGSILSEYEFIPAEKVLGTRVLGKVGFLVSSLGAYLKPDNSQHIIMSEAQGGGPISENLFLSWGSPNLGTFEYGALPGY